jgi:hypothetical protein
MLKTIGMIDVAALAAEVGGAPPIGTITEIRRSSKSAASIGSRSYCPSAQRYSTAKF